MTSNVSSGVNKMVGGIKSSLLDIAKSITGIGALMASGSFLSSLYSESKEFTKQMKIVSTISGEVAADMQGYKDQVLALCRQIAVAPDTAAAALYQINSAGHLGADGMKVLEASAKAAVGGVTETAVAADAITTILNAYRMKADEAEAVSDKLFTTVRLGKTTMDELGRSIATVAPLAATYKISIDEILAAVAQLTKQGNSTQNAMTQVSASILAVASELGDSAFENGLLPALQEIEKRSDGSNAALKAQLSNVRAVRAALGISKENAAETADFINQIKNSSGAANDAYKIMNKGASAEMRMLRTNFLNELQSMGDGATSILADISHSMNEAFRTGSIKDLENELLILISTYGALKVYMALDNTKQVMMYEAEKQALASLLAPKEANVDADLQEAVSKKKLTQAQAEEVAALRAEVAAKKQAAFVSQDKAAKELAEANVAKSAANTRVATLKMREDALNREIMAAHLSGNAEAERTLIQQANAVTTERQAAVTELNTITKQAEKAQTDYNTASTELETIAKVESTIATQKDTTQRGLWAVITNICSKAQEKLNRAISANKYMLIAAAIAAVAVAIYKLCTYQTEAEKRQKRLNDAFNKCQGEIAAESVKIDVLFDRLRKAKKGTDEFRDAKKDILDQYGNYLNSLSNEVSSLQDVEAAYRAVKDAAEQAARARAMDAYVKQEGDNYAEDYAKRYDKIYNYIKKKKGQAFADAHKKTINDVISGKSNWTQDFLSQFDEVRAVYMGQYAPAQTYTHNELKSLTAQARRGKADYEKTVEDARARFGITDEPKPQKDDGLHRDHKTKEVIQDYAYWEHERDNAERALKAMKSTELASSDAIQLKAKITEANQKLAEYDNASRAGKKSDSGKTQAEKDSEAAQAEQDRLKLEADQARERERATKDGEFAVREARINAMAESGDKVLVQQQLEFERQQEETHREYEDAILAEVEYQKSLFDAQEEANAKNAAAHGNDHYAKKVFDPKSIGVSYDDKGTPSVDASALVNADGTETFFTQLKTRYDGILDYMKTAYANTIAQAETEAMTEYLAQWGDYAQKRAAIIAKAEQDKKKATTDGERAAIDKQKDKDIADLDLTEFKKTSGWNKAFKNLDNVASSSLTALKKKMQDYIKTHKDLTPERIEELNDSIERLDSEVNDRNPFAALSTSLSDLVTANKRVKPAQEAYNKALKDGTDAEKEQAEATLNAAKDLKQKALNDMTKAMQGAISQMQEYIGVATAMTEMLAAFGIEIPPELAGFISGLGDALSGLESIDLTRPMSIITGAFKAVAGIGKAIGSLFNHDDRKEKNIQKMQKEIDKLQNSYDRLGKNIDKVYSKDASKIINQQNTMLRQQQQLIRNQIAEEKSKKHTDNDKIAQWEQQLSDIEDTINDNKVALVDAIMGEDVKSAINNFADAYASMFDQGISKTKASKDLIKQMIKNMIMEAMKADISEPMERLREMMMGFFSNDKIEDWEKEALEREGEKIMNDLSEKYSWADSFFEDSNSQSGGSRGGFTAMSQDTADELNGRFTAIQMDSAAIRNAVGDMNASLLEVRVSVTEARRTQDELRDISLIAIDHLETIARNTNELYEMNERLDKIERNTRRL
jgi:TP901 family phage tail tape measure protein